MGNEQYGGVLFPQFFELSDAPVCKYRITNRKGLIDDENVRIDVYGGRKGQSHIHTARILLDRPIDEISNFRKGFDRRQVPVHLRPRNPHNLAVDEDVFAPGKFGIESSAEFKQSGDSPSSYDAPRSRLQNTTHNLQKGALAAAVRSDEAHDFAPLHGKRDIPKSPEIGVERSAPKRIQLSNPIKRRSVKPV